MSIRSSLIDTMNCDRDYSYGAVLLEFAIAIPLILVLLSALIDYGLATRDLMGMQELAFVSARATARIIHERQKGPPAGCQESCITCRSNNEDISKFTKGWIDSHWQAFGLKSERFSSPEVSILSAESGDAPMLDFAPPPLRLLQVDLSRNSGGCLLCLGQYIPFLPSIQVRAVERILYPGPQGILGLDDYCWR